MKRRSTLIIFPLFVLLFSSGTSYGQVDSQKVAFPPQPIQLNAGFDVIVKINGDIVNGLVKEVGLYLISYQRTDIPNGPIYTMLRSEVHAISYRNQVKEYFYPLTTSPVTPLISSHHNAIDYNRVSFFEQGVLRISFGFIKNYTKVNDSKSYLSKGTFPAVNIGYDVLFNHQVRLGLQMGFGSRKFSNQSYSSYDSVQNDIQIKENIFSLFAYARYEFMQNSSRLRPYFTGGVGIRNSGINSDNRVNFTNNNSQTLLVQTGTHSVSLGLMARVGADYYLNDQYQLFLEGGVGLTVLNAGLAITLK